MTDRDDLLGRTADTLHDAFDRAIAAPEGRAAYDNLTRHGSTLTINGREVSPETGEVSDDAGDEPDRWRERRVEGLVWDADPDARVYTPSYDLITLGEQGTISHRSVSLPYVESALLARVGEALIARDKTNLGALGRWGIRIAYLFAEDLGNESGGPRLWQLKKPSKDAVWALGQGRERRVVDLHCLVNARIVRYAEMTNWQIQATLHTALGHARVSRGRLAIEPRSPAWEHRLYRRYGNWLPDLQALAEVLRLAEADQLPLWEDEGDDDE
jgi:hypothetical protein